MVIWLVTGSRIAVNAKAQQLNGSRAGTACRPRAHRPGDGTWLTDGRIDLHVLHRFSEQGEVMTGLRVTDRFR